MEATNFRAAIIKNPEEVESCYNLKIALYTCFIEIIAFFFTENRNKKWDHTTRKKEAKLAKKLKVLERRKNKRTKNKVKFAVQPEINKGKKKQENGPKSKSQFILVILNRYPLTCYSTGASFTQFKNKFSFQM